jgi:hypothetical protein
MTSLSPSKWKHVNDVFIIHWMHPRLFLVNCLGGNSIIMSEKEHGMDTWMQPFFDEVNNNEPWVKDELSVIMVMEMRASVFENKAVTNVGNDYLHRVAVHLNRPDKDSIGHWIVLSKIAVVHTIGFTIENCNMLYCTNENVCSFHVG